MDADAVLPVLPWTAAVLAVVLLVGLQVPPPAAPPRATGGTPSGRGLVAVGLLLLALAVAARLVGGNELDNPVSPLVVGLGWPLLLLAPLVLSPLLPRRAEDGRAGDVRPALPLALLVVGVLAVVPAPGRPPVLAATLGAYVVLLAAAALAGGAALAARADAVGLLARWSALGPRLPGWVAPRGAAAVLVLVAGGAWAERYARTAAWTQAALPGTGARVLLLALAVGLAAVLAVPLRRYGAAAVLVPLAAGAVVGGSLRRALISAQLLAGSDSVAADPLGVPGGQLLALALVAALGSVAAAVLARRAGPAADRLPGLASVLAATGVTAWLVLQP